MTSSRAKLNMSDFLANLNTTAAVPEAKDDFAQIDLFANTDFLNYDILEPLSTDVQFDQQPDSATDNQQSWTSPSIIGNDFHFTSLPLSDTQKPNALSSNAFPLTDTLFNVQPSQSVPQPGAKRKLELLDPSLGPAERARVEAEEDKRRRNTAASARFRVKKKQREQALEKTAKEMTEKASKLEKRVHELELENKWLKGLITEKTGDQQFSDMLAKFLAENGDSNSEDDHKVEDDVTAA